MARITDAMLYNKADRSMNRSRKTMIENQEKAVTGKRINRPSDDPQALMRVMGVNAKIDRNEQTQKNMEIAISHLSVTDSALAELTDVLTRAKELAIQMSNSSNQSSDAFQAAKSEVESLFYQVVQIGNSRVGDHYVFGGFKNDRPPFDVDGNFFGDDGSIQIELQPGQRVSMNISGLLPFAGMKEMPIDINTLDGDLEDGKKEWDMRVPASERAQGHNVQLLEGAEPPGENVFRVFKGLLEGIEKGVPSEINNALDGIDKTFSQVLSARAQVGALQNAIESNQNFVDSQQSTNAVLKSSLIDADTTQVYSDLARNESTLNATLEANKKLLTPSLLDFLK